MPRVARLIYVAINDGKTATKHQAKQSNKFYNMTENGDTIDIEYGRVDHTCTKTSKPISQWDKILRSKIKKGYKDVTHLACEEEEPKDSGTSLQDISDRAVHMLFDQLQSFANKTIKANYKVSSKKVTQAMIDEAQGHVNTLGSILSNKKKGYEKEFNDELLALFHVIPRKMDNVSRWLVDTSLVGDSLFDKCQKLLNKEQSTLDVMAGQVVVNSKTDDTTETDADTKRDLLEVLGLEVRETESSEDDKIKALMGPNSRQFKKGYKVVNKTTQKAFDNHLKTVDNKKTELFWHGSRNENWLNILSTGLLIRPSGAVHTGSMFGDGIYFADKAQKSIGYSSLRGSYWTGGSDNTAYLALFDVHVGEQKHIKRHSRDCYSLDHSRLKGEGLDSVFAHGGADLRNNEYIVYQSQQCTVSYLIEIG